MFGRKIAILAAGYLAWNVVASVYWSGKKWKKPSSKKDIKKMAHDFMTTQKNFMKDVEEKYVSDEHKETFKAKKAEFLKMAQSYKDSWESLLSQAQEKGASWKESINSLIDSGANVLKWMFWSITKVSEKAQEKLEKVSPKDKK